VIAAKRKNIALKISLSLNKNKEAIPINEANQYTGVLAIGYKIVKEKNHKNIYLENRRNAMPYNSISQIPN
jgi:hypothetical protein